jgi:kynurenine formamidase
MIVDLTHVVEDGMVTYPGLPGPEIGDHLSYEASHERYAPGTEFQIGRITMVANTGTYLDAPSHRYRGAADLAAVPLERVADVPGVRVDAPGPAIGPEAFDGVDVRGRAVLVRTGWDRSWRTPEYGGPGSPFITREAAEHLVARHASLVGIDSVNIDDTRGSERPVHTLLLAREVPVVEHLTGLDQLPATGATFTAVPVKVRGMSTFPVRAFATLPH